MVNKYFKDGIIEIGRETMPLDNITENKTYFVFECIKKLQPRNRMNNNAQKKFEQIKSRALDSTSAEQALSIIGYDYRKVPTIYKVSFDEGDRR